MIKNCSRERGRITEWARMVSTMVRVYMQPLATARPAMPCIRLVYIRSQTALADRQAGTYVRTQGRKFEDQLYSDSACQSVTDVGGASATRCYDGGLPDTM